MEAVDSAAFDTQYSMGIYTRRRLGAYSSNVFGGVSFAISALAGTRCASGSPPGCTNCEAKQLGFTPGRLYSSATSLSRRVGSWLRTSVSSAVIWRYRAGLVLTRKQKVKIYFINFQHYTLLFFKLK